MGTESKSIPELIKEYEEQIAVCENNINKLKGKIKECRKNINSCTDIFTYQKKIKIYQSMIDDMAITIAEMKGYLNPNM